MPGVFSKSVGWIVATVKNVSKIANIGKRGVLFVWQDETGMKVVGSPSRSAAIVMPVMLLLGCC